jgi:hypothetical protein
LLTRLVLFTRLIELALTAEEKKFQTMSPARAKTA